MRKKMIVMIYHFQTFVLLSFVYFANCDVPPIYRRNSNVLNVIFNRPYQEHVCPKNSLSIILKKIPSTNMATCCNKCIHLDGCLSFTHQSSTCSLLRADRTTLEDADFVETTHCSYFDTVFRDKCSENYSCYPYRCFTYGYHRSKCMRSKFMKSETPTSLSNSKFIAVSGYKRYAIVHTDNRLILYHNNVGTTSIYRLKSAKTIQQIELMPGSMELFVVLTPEGTLVYLAHKDHNEFTAHNNDLNLQCGFFSIIKQGEYLCVDKVDKKLWYMNMVEERKEERSQTAMSQAIEMNGVTYGVKDGCDGVYTLNKDGSWAMYAARVPDQCCVDMKVKFDGVVYCKHDNDYVYEYDEIRKEWSDVSGAKCKDYAIDDYRFLYLNSNDEVVKNAKFILRPFLHIAFKQGLYNGNKTITPIGRGRADDGNTKIELIDSANIVLDQFGKGYVLALNTKQEQTLGGKFTALSQLSTHNRRITFAGWFRLGVSSLVNYYEFTCKVKQVINGEGFSLLLENGEVRVKIQYNSQTMLKVCYGTPPVDNFLHWTHVGFTFENRDNTKELTVFINGTNCNAVEVSDDLIMHDGVLFLACIGGFISDLSLWPANIQPSRMKSIYKADLANDEWLKHLSYVNAKSCIELLRERPYSASGLYIIVINGELGKVYCDMATDGGGWLQIAHMTKKYSKATLTSLFYSHYKLGLTASHDYAFKEVFWLLKYSGYKQMRYRCEQPDGKILDYATSIEDQSFIEKMVTSKSSTINVDACTGIYFLEDDNSKLSQLPCDDLVVADSSFNDGYIFGRTLMDSADTMAFNVKRLECDTHFTVDGELTEGEWMVYVR